MLAVGTAISISSCSKDEEPTGSGGNANPEGYYAGTWRASGNQIPAKLRDNVASMELTIDEAENYTWKWQAPDGKVSTFEGTVLQSKTEYKHSTNSHIWEINIKVTHLNGQPAPGGWAGLYAYADPNNLILNVEPAVSGVMIPLASEGLGSGQNGNDGIYHFTKD